MKKIQLSYRLSPKKINLSVDERAKKYEEDQEYAYFPYRLLSATEVGKGGWNATRFSENVLRSALPMFEGTPWRKDHSKRTDDAIANAVDVWWEESYTASSGTVVPAGVNGFVKIKRTEANQELIEKLDSDPTPLQSVSAGLTIEWQPSHEFEDEYDFWRLLGERIDGKLVCFIATKIDKVSEVSFVWQGADEFAKRLRSSQNGATFLEGLKLLQVPEATIQAYEKIDQQRNQKAMDLALAKKKETEDPEKSEPEKPQQADEDSSQDVNFDKEKIVLAVEKATKELEAKYEKAQADLQNAQSELQNLKEALSLSESRYNTAQVKLAEAKPLIEFAKKIKSEKIDYALGVYETAKAVKGREPNSDKMRATLEKADDETINELIESWGGESFKAYGTPSCKECGSQDFEIQNSPKTDTTEYGGLKTSEKRSNPSTSFLAPV